MVEKTPRLDLDDYEPGDTDWDHSDTVNALDEHAIVRGPIADRPAEGDYDDELYHATDQGITWRWDSTAGDWEYFSGQGSSDQPVPGTSHFEAANVGELSNIADWVIDDLSGLESIPEEQQQGTIVVGQPDTPYRLSRWLDMDYSHWEVVFQSPYAKNGEPIIKVADGANVGGFRLASQSNVSDFAIRNIGFDGNYPNQDQSVENLDMLQIRDNGAEDFEIENFYATETSPHHSEIGSDAHGAGGKAVHVFSAAKSSTSDYTIRRGRSDSIGDQTLSIGGRNLTVDTIISRNGFDRAVSVSGATNAVVSKVIGDNHEDGAVVGCSYSNEVEVSQVIGNGTRSVFTAATGNHDVHASDIKGINNTHVVRLRSDSESVKVDGVSGIAESDWTGEMNHGVYVTGSVDEIEVSDVRIENNGGFRAVSINTSGSDIVMRDITVRGDGDIYDEVGAKWYGVDAGGAVVDVDSAATDTRFHNTEDVGSWSDSGTRTVRNGWGANAGDPSAGNGDWAGNGYEGLNVRDTSNGANYAYVNGGWVAL